MRAVVPRKEPPVKRTIRVLLAAAALAPAGASADVIYLDRPGVLEAIAAENPEHHQRLLGILKASQEMPCQRESFERLKAEFDAREARCTTYLLTSLPAKRRLAFKLDDQKYQSTVEMAVHEKLVKVPSTR
jgi:hypothetical protein